MSRRSGRLHAKNVKCDSENECPTELAPRKRKYEEIETTNEHQQDAQRHKYEIQGCWSQITTGTATPCILIETPQKETESSPDMSKFTRYRFKNLFISPCPLPELSWANSKDVWVKMLDKETRYLHSSGILRNHSALNTDMRVILMDWLIEVSEVYSLHRETFYLAQDFFDRFMSTQSQVGKSMLQLIGVTCLFIASKLEVCFINWVPGAAIENKEIYPPKINEFAYVTDGACCEDDIIDMELIVLKALKWELCPVTAIAWLNLYLQVSSLKDVPKLLLPQYSQEQFIHIAQLLDLCILDSSALDFKYRILAAAALYHHTSMEIVTKATGLAWESISECVQWISPCARAARRF
uniref:Cyclin E2 n=1 Tax=Leptobrachium leishanense TaxID=445787 RepID=A0A8C5PLT5_9ANUR